MGAAPAIYDWLKLDRVVTPTLRVRGWEKDPKESIAAKAGAHAGVELALIESGTVMYTIGDREIIAEQGSIVVVPREVEHKTTFLTPMRGVALWLGADMIAEVADAMGPDAGSTMLAPGTIDARKKRIHTLLRVLVDEVEDGAAGYARAAESITESIVIEMLRHAPRREDLPGLASTKARDPRVCAAIERMRESLADTIGVDDLAKAAGMSRFHFSRLFRDEIGEAPYQYLLRMRIARAIELLRGGHSSVTEAALACGFSDFSRFASTFKKHTGKRPQDVRRAARSA